MPPQPLQPSELTGAQKKELRGLAQRLKPVVHLGKAGLTATVLAEIDTALKRDQLVKVRLPGDRQQREALSQAIAQGTASCCVGRVGGVASYFRPQEANDSEANFS
jgi:RNA-binding protein